MRALETLPVIWRTPSPLVTNAPSMIIWKSVTFRLAPTPATDTSPSVMTFPMRPTEPLMRITGLISPLMVTPVPVIWMKDAPSDSIAANDSTSRFPFTISAAPSARLSDALVSRVRSVTVLVPVSRGRLGTDGISTLSSTVGTEAGLQLMAVSQSSPTSPVQTMSKPVRAVTVRVAVPVTPAAVARTSVVPKPTEVTRPVASTVATAASDVLHTTDSA